MKSGSDFDVNGSWRWLLQEILLARNAHQVGNPLGPSVVKSLLDLLLPSLLYIRTVSLLDESLSTYIDNKGCAVPKQYGTTLHGRLTFLNDQGLLPYSQDLHDIKDRRNEVAHRSNKPEMAIKVAVKWEDLDRAVSIVEAALQHLNLIGARPSFEFHHERNVDTHLDAPSPDKPDVIMTHHYHYGVKENNDWVIKLAQSYDYHRAGS